MNVPRTVAYQFILKAKRDEKNELVWDLDKDIITRLFLGFPWQDILAYYNKRSKFYYGFSISGCGDDAPPLLDAKVELHKPSLITPEFLLEIALMPNKLDSKQREIFNQVVDDESLLSNDDFKIWWDDDPRGPRKRKLKDKQKLVSELKKINHYSGSDDLKMEDAELSIEEALNYFQFDLSSSTKDIKKNLKLKYRELQLRDHPDSETGSEEAFLFLQRCYNLLKGVK